MSGAAQPTIKQLRAGQEAFEISHLRDKGIELEVVGLLEKRKYTRV